ncbi:MAG: hypothetical protein ACLP0A_04430 [Verrucomicrobiia bacterium]
MALEEGSSVPSARGMLDWELPCALRIVLLGLVVAIPVGYVFGHYSPQTGFTRLILFGEDVYPRVMPEVKACQPAVVPNAGYDAQWYCQVAIDPTLRNPHLKDGLDLPEYRSTRILLPALAYVGGAGNPCRIIQVFGVLNLLFWLLLVFGMVRYLRPSTVREYLCVVAAVLTSGAMFSVARSLTDLPAATLAFYSAALSGTAAAATMALALLTKETFVLSLPRLMWPLNRDRPAIGGMAAQLAVAVLPLAVWYLYTHLHFGFQKFDVPNTSWPGAGLVDYLRRAWHHWYPNRILSPRLSQELLAPISLIVQVGYLLWRHDFKSPYWRMGIGFAFGFLILSPDVFIDQYSFTRDALPLTLAFNIGLMKEKRARFLFWFIAGNVGLLSGTREMLLFLK